MDNFSPQKGSQPPVECPSEGSGKQTHDDEHPAESNESKGENSAVHGENLGTVDSGMTEPEISKVVDTAETDASKEEAQLALEVFKSLRNLVEKDQIDSKDRSKALSDMSSLVGGPANLRKIIHKLTDPSIAIKIEPQEAQVIEIVNEPRITIKTIKTKKSGSKVPKTHRELDNLLKNINEMHERDAILQLNGPRKGRKNYKEADELSE